MTEHNWKPGDLAMSSQGSVFAIETERGVRWVYDDGSGGHETARMSYEASVPSGLRPLVVIDAEDREQVERLTNALDQFITRGDDYADGVQAALREFAAPTPPKLDEPTQIGAVVEVSHKVYGWARAVLIGDGFAPWYYTDSSGNGGLRKWDDLDVTRVLSEGVTA